MPRANPSEADRIARAANLELFIHVVLKRQRRDRSAKLSTRLQLGALLPGNRCRLGIGVDWELVSTGNWGRLGIGVDWELVSTGNRGRLGIGVDWELGRWRPVVTPRCVDRGKLNVSAV